MTPEEFARICEWDAKCTWPENTMFGTTLDRRRCIEYVKELQLENERLNRVITTCPLVDVQRSLEEAQARIGDLELTLESAFGNGKFSPAICRAMMKFWEGLAKRYEAERFTQGG